MQITLEVNDTVFDKFIWMLEHFKNDVKIVEDESIDLQETLKTMQKLQSGDLSDFEVIEDIDEHIKELTDVTR